ncbi:MAG: RNA 2',3'-cyclic phosphodiesterase [Candidatus Limnocylindrales bacterium]
MAAGAVPGSAADPGWRLFFALPLPPPAVSQVVDLVEPLRATFPTTRWTAASTYHLTLLFLGDLPVSALEELRAVLAVAAGGTRPFGLRLEGAGSFGGRGRPRTAWLGLEQGGEQAASGLVAALQGGLVRSRNASLAALVTAAEPFRAHLTVGRRAEPEVPGALARRLAAQPQIAWRADRVALMRSRLDADGAQHSVVAWARLGQPSRPLPSALPPEAAGGAGAGAEPTEGA